MGARDVDLVLGAAGSSAAAATSGGGTAAAGGVSTAPPAGVVRRLRFASCFLWSNISFGRASPAAHCSSKTPCKGRLPLAAAVVVSCSSSEKGGAAVASLSSPLAAVDSPALAADSSTPCPSAASPPAASSFSPRLPHTSSAAAAAPAEPSAAAPACAVATAAAVAAAPSASATAAAGSSPAAAAAGSCPAASAAGSSAPASSSPSSLPPLLRGSSVCVSARRAAAATASATAAAGAAGCPYGYEKEKEEQREGGRREEALLQQPPEAAVLSDLRRKSSIPSKNGDMWTYPSERQFYRVTRSKGHRVAPEDMHAVVAIHNAVNERAWQQILAYENLHRNSCAAPRLERFLGRPTEMSFKAKTTHFVLGWELPFDRHEWLVDRCGEKVKYLIDFYDGQTNAGEKSAASIYIDARPDIWGRTGLLDRVKLFFIQKKLLPPCQ